MCHYSQLYKHRSVIIKYVRLCDSSSRVVGTPAVGGGGGTGAPAWPEQAEFAAEKLRGQESLMAIPVAGIVNGSN